MGQQAEKKDKTERVTGLGRKTREEIVKWNQMTGLRFHKGGDIRQPRGPSRGAKDSTGEIIPLFSNNLKGQQGWELAVCCR